MPAGAEVVLGDALREDTFAGAIAPADTLVHLVGTPNPGPAKAEQFRTVDLVSIGAAVAAARRAGVRHLVYVSVAQPAPVMRAYIAVRQEGEALVRASGLAATIVRPWYVLGPGHRWPVVLVPLYAVMRRIPATRERAERLGLVTLAQMVATLALSVEHPPDGIRIVDVPQIGRARLELTLPHNFDVPMRTLFAVLVAAVFSCTVAAQAPAGWPLHGQDLGGRRFSPLTAIDTANVARLVPAWTYHSGVTATFQATPIVANGVMYVSLPLSGVVALDPATGRELWRYRHQSRAAKLCCGPANRGVAVSGGKVYVGTVDGGGGARRQDRRGGVGRHGRRERHHAAERQRSVHDAVGDDRRGLEGGGDAAVIGPRRHQPRDVGG